MALILTGFIAPIPRDARMLTLTAAFSASLNTYGWAGIAEVFTLGFALFGNAVG